MTGEPLYAERYFQDSRNKMRSLVVPLLPQEFMTMKSGRGFHETCNNIIVAQYRKDLLVSAGTRPGTIHVEEAKQKLPPLFGSTRSPHGCYFCVSRYSGGILTLHQTLSRSWVISAIALNRGLH
jgi:hypothetical protein